MSYRMMSLRNVATWLLFLTISMFVKSGDAVGGEIQQQTDPTTGWAKYILTQDETTAVVVPEAGCNVAEFNVGSVHLLREPESLAKLPGVGYGVPILYPTPNRVRGGTFSFAGETFTFPINSNGNFIHGLVHSVPWEVIGIGADSQQAWITCALRFSADSELHRQFPIAHRIEVTICLSAQKVRWEYRVANQETARSLPFGFALHPYFVYQGQRDNTYLTLPARHWMESVELLPTGKLVDQSERVVDLRQPQSLAGLQLDDVFTGLSPEQPTVIDFRDRALRLELRTSPDVTHVVVYTPDRPYFCVENQTCSTDAHNLSAAGHRDAAHLLVCPPGESMSGWIEYRVRLSAAGR